MSKKQNKLIDFLQSESDDDLTDDSICLERYTRTKTKPVVQVLQKPVRRIVSRKVVTETVVPGKYKVITPSYTIKEINHKIVDYKDKKYIVGYTIYIEEPKLFVLNYENDEQYQDFIHKSWHYRSDGGYIASQTVDTNDDHRKELYLHNYAMNKLTFNGKGQHHTIDHINRLGRDNRTDNLRVLSQSHQNTNQNKRERKIVLPENCNIEPNDIPKNINFRAGKDAHGDIFYIELKHPDVIKVLCPDKNKYSWSSTKSKKIDLRVKLQQCINHLEEIRKNNPSISHLFDVIDNIKERNDLIKSFNEIISLSGYPVNIINSNKGIEFIEHIAAPISEVQEQLSKEIEEKTIKGVRSHLPESCGVTVQMIPKYCYYKPASETRGDKFIIERHPQNVKDGKRMWATTESKKISTIDKYNMMIIKMQELDDLYNNSI